MVLLMVIILISDQPKNTTDTTTSRLLLLQFTQLPITTKESACVPKITPSASITILKTGISDTERYSKADY
ncbi:Alpha-L-arabinofuranosidase A [Fusarium oxysporum f. sp. albedinis]|nr:Alpha-L-arabinofuranosidase A [Fusarium oxysporum f. sp. albedinis]